MQFKLKTASKRKITKNSKLKHARKTSLSTSATILLLENFAGRKLRGSKKPQNNCDFTE